MLLALAVVNLWLNILWSWVMKLLTVSLSCPWTPDCIICGYGLISCIEKAMEIDLFAGLETQSTTSWLELKWTWFWIWLVLDWCGPNCNPDITAGSQPGCPLRAGWLVGLEKIGENRRRKSAGVARACSFERGVLGSVWNLCLIWWSNCAKLAGRQEASPPQLGA